MTPWNETLSAVSALNLLKAQPWKKKKTIKMSATLILLNNTKKLIPAGERLTGEG